MDGQRNAKRSDVIIREVDLAETFSRSSGPGGQNVNKVSTSVTLRHLPSGITVTVQDSRSQARNRELARERLSAAIQRRDEALRQAQRAAASRIRRRNSQRPHALKRKILDAKKKRGAVKKLRGRVSD